MAWAHAVGGTALLGLVVTGCSVGAFDPTAHTECPCIAGFTCDETRNVCIRLDGASPMIDGGVVERDGGGPRRDGGGPDPDGGVDGGTPETDGGGVDAGSGTNCDGPLGDRLFCDGFESGDTSLWDGTDSNGFGSVTVVGDVVYMGGNALRVEGGIGAGYGHAWKEVFPVAGITDQWLRAYYYFPAANGLGAEVNSMGDLDDAYDVVVSVQDGFTNYHTHSWAVDSRVDGSRAIGADTWTCIELHIHFGVTDGAIELYFDDELVASSGAIDTSVPRGLPVIVAGLAWKNVDLEHVVYVDEVVADTAQVGCD